MVNSELKLSPDDWGDEGAEGNSLDTDSSITCKHAGDGKGDCGACKMCGESQSRQSRARCEASCCADHEYKTYMPPGASSELRVCCRSATTVRCADLPTR